MSLYSYFKCIKESQIMEQSKREKDLEIAREFVADVMKLAKERNLPVFVVTDGASGTSNNNCEAVKHARDCHKQWELKHGFDPDEDWSKD